MKKHFRRPLHPRRAAMPVWLLLFLFITSAVQATDFVVTNGNNTGAGSLRQAILDANASGATPHTITFTYTGVVNITTSLPTITRQVTIDGGSPGAVIISGPGGNNLVALFVLGTGSNGSTLRNLTMRDTGLEPVRLSVALSGITIQNMVFSQTGVHYMNRGILANAAVSDLVIRNVVVTQLEDKLQGIYFGGNVTNVLIDSFRLSGGGGLTARGIHVQGVANGFTLKNSVIDLDDPATTDDGDYGLFFNSTANNVTVDSSVFRDNEVSAIYVAGTATAFHIKNTRFDNLDGSASAKLVQFMNNVTNLTIDQNIFDADLRSTADDGNYGLIVGGAANQTVNITNNQFIENDSLGIFFGGNALTNNHDHVLIKGNTFTRNGSNAGYTGGIDFLARNLTSDGGPVLITENTFTDNMGEAILVRPGNGTTYVTPNFTISKNTIYNTKSTLGAIRVHYLNKIVITQNSIYNNQGLGIELISANCSYEGANTPQILSSVETAAGIYTVTVKMPAICGTGNCSLELFSNEAGIKGVGGQHYVTTKTGLASGNQVLTGITGSFPGITSAPYGTWSATLRVANNCGTSEFGNRKAIKSNGPAGIANGIAFWLRGDEISVNNAEPTANGQTITGWQDFSGDGPSATTVINNPLTKLSGINYHPVADMDADGIRGNFTGVPSFIATPTVTTVAVFNPLSATASGDRIFTLYAQGTSDYNSNLGMIEFYRVGDNIQSYRGNTLLEPPINGTTGVKALDRPGIFTSLTSAAAHSSYYNGSLKGSGSYNKGNFAISQWFIGTGYNTTNGWANMSEVDFAEVFTYNRVLSASELQKVHSYMALKYGIALQQSYLLSDGTPVWDIAANATYSKEIAGLARDNVSVLHQKQARAFHADEVVSIALGSALAATNNDHEGAIPNNLSVFMWGNDSASTSFIKPFTGANSSARMERVWKVQRTNWADQDITIRLNNGKDNIYLLISADPSFATVTQELPLNSNGTVTISSALLGNGQYFTFGRQQRAPGGVLTGLDVWTKADEGVALSGTSAVSWEDQGPSMRIWQRVNANPLPWNSAEVNYNPAIRFPGPGAAANYFNFQPQFTPTYTQGEIFSVQSSAVNSVEGFPWQLGGNSGTTPLWYRYTDNNMYLHFGTNARRNFSFGAKNLALPAILNVNTLANSWTASMDGKVMSGPAAYTTSFAQTATVNAIGVAYASYFNGPVSEVILYKRKLTATERQQVNSYLAIRYGITLDQSTPTDYLASDGLTTMWKASDNTGYANNIAGIGRDDGGALYQKQSRSINTAAGGNIVAIATGTSLAASNEANTVTIGNNRSFLVWGDNNGAITFTTAATGNNVTLRMPRVWKVDKTNWASGPVTLKFFGNITNTYLLISNTDASFATIDQELALNADSTLTISSDLLPDGAWFTFGRQIVGPGYVNAGVQMWLRADDGVSSGSNWIDYSGNDASARQAAAGSQPAFQVGVVNFNPAFRFDGNDDYMDFSSPLSLTGTNPFTVAGLGVRETVVDWDAFLAAQTTTTGGFLLGTDPTGKTQIHRTGTGVLLQGAAVNNKVNLPYLVTGTRNGNNLALYNNGAADGAGTTTQTFNVTNVRLGNRNTSADLAFAGKIPEVVVYNRALAPFELQRLHAYLAIKYGLTLDQTVPTDYVATDWDGSTGTKIWTASKNTGFNRNIAGIGRDEKTGLHQKQSRSSSDSLITIAAGNSIAADNASNTSDLDDLSFFTWADNGGAATFSVGVSSVANATNRMARVWKVDRTNWDDREITIKVQQGGDRYLLVHATDASFGAGTQEFAINTVTGTVSLNTADLPDGAYFTLATRIVGPGCVNTGIATWLRADYAASAGSWIDFSGNQTNAAQAATANQPDLLESGLNYHPALSFNGTTDNLVIPNAAIAGKYSFGNVPRTVIGVGATNVVSSSYNMMFAYGVNGTGTGLYLGQAAGNSLAGFGGYGTAAMNLPGTANSLPASNTRIIGGRYTGSVARLDVNGVLNASLTTAWNTSAAQPAYVGLSATTNSQYWNGKIGEVIVYNRELTAPELQRVNSYLALKYGITLDQTAATDYIASDGSTRMWTASDNTGYSYRITGIGRDDCTNLYQRQSISADAGILAIAIGDGVAASNLANDAEITSDNSYFVIADNNGAVQYNTAISGPDALTTRMARTWKVDKTNWTDAGVTFRLTGGNEKIYLVVSADATFDGSDVAYKLDADGNVTIPTDLIPDGAYFTFAKTLTGPGYVNVGIQMWLRADDNVSAPDSWKDASGNDNHALQASVANQPAILTNNTNYNPGFSFNGTSTYMTPNITLLPTGTTARTLIGVGTPTTVAGTRYMMGWGTANTSQFIGLANVTTASNFVGWADDLSAAGMAAVGVPQELTGTWAGAGGAASLYSKMRSLASVNKNWTTGTAAGAFIGSQVVANNQLWQGSLNELIVYNRAITEPERRRISSYLAIKYGYTLDQTTPNDYVATDWDGVAGTKYWNGTANAANKNNITGIGRDDNTGLYQKQSRSVNTTANGNMVAIGLGTIAATNKDNTATFDEDLSFLVWGDNGLTGTKTTEYPTALDPGGCSKITRLQREWKVQVTGSVNTVQVQYYLAGLVPTSTNISDLRLLIDDDGDFSTGITAVVEAAAYDAATQVATFNDVNFTDGQYFTLVTDLTNQAPGGVITNLYTWYRADKGISTATGVNLAIDQSASARDITQATGTAQPAYNTAANLINFNPTIGFVPASAQVLSNAAINHTATNGEDIFAVVLPNAVAAYHDIVGLGTVTNTNTATELRFNANRLEYLANNGTLQAITNPVATNGMVQLANGNRSNAGAASLLLNGGTVATGTISQLPPATQFNFGARRTAGANSFYFDGKIAEVALYNRQLTTPERQQVASYLAVKYGITLPHNYVDPAGTVIWDAGLNAGYGSNITGIGRDDCNGLHQKQSKSVNTAEALVTLGNYTGIASTNADNPNLLDNATALLLGDNNANRSAWTSTGAPLNRQRIARAWKVQETGNIGIVTVQVPASTSPLPVRMPLENDGVLYLLVSNSGNFTTGATEIPMTLNGTNWEASVDFSNAQYFTFATNDACISVQPLLTTYGAGAAIATDKCYVDGWILFRDPADNTKFIAGIYDPAGLIDRTKITAKVDAASALADLGKGNTTQAARLMRRMLQVDCASCYDAAVNPNPAFTVRMFYAPSEKSDAENAEINNMESIKTANGLTDPHVFKWFKAAGQTVSNVLSNLSARGIGGNGQEWFDGTLATGQLSGVDYVDFAGVNGFSTFGGIWTVNLQQVLPVTWLQVQAVPTANNTIQVKWSVIGQANNAGFAVERSQDGVHFQPIANVSPQAAVAGMPSYYTSEDKAVVAAVTYYYRIRQMDLDGRVGYSRVVSARVSTGGLPTLSVTPNPVTDKLRWQVNVPKAQTLQVSIIDMKGRVVAEKKIAAQPGFNQYTMEVRAWTSGTYLLRMNGEDGETYSEKFIVR